MAAYDVGIIGAGILGAAVARELSHYELRILWLEKATDVASGITRGNTSIIHGGFDDAAGSVKGLYAKHGVAMIEALDQHLHFGFRKCGSLVVGFSETDGAKLHALRANGQKNGVRGLELWGRSELAEREPSIHPEATCALYAPESGVVIAPEFCLALAENAVSNGIELHLGEELCAVRPGYELETLRDGRTFCYTCRYLVNAAGWGALPIARMLARPPGGPLDYELQPVKGQYLVFDRSCGQLAQHVLFPLPDKIRGKGITVCPTYHGNLLLGPDAEFVADPDDLSTNLETLRGIYLRAQNLVPGIPRSRVIRSYAGMRPRLKEGHGTKAGDFLIRYWPDRCELLGIASPGLTSALPIARELAAKLAEFWARQGWKLARKAHFQMERKPWIGCQRDKIFLTGQELKQYVERPLDDPECLVCRCEQVRSRVIQAAITSSLVSAARNLDFIKWRTRATMGFCQGQFCGPRLKKLLHLLTGQDKIPDPVKPGRIPPERLRREL